uniref:Uncharacterized protein n=1 Tax=Medicago truncatula TaxID=3880 RepID=I3SNN0_MEDTR|nr:unknown [Medicago truncatula]
MHQFSSFEHVVMVTPRVKSFIYHITLLKSISFNDHNI